MLRLLAVALTLGACAGGNTGDQAESPSLAASATSTASPTPEPEPTYPDVDSNGVPDGDDCRKQLGKFLNALDAVDSRLDVGLVQADLNNFVGDASVEYNKINFRQLPLNCVRDVGVPLKQAFNAPEVEQSVEQLHLEPRL